MSNDCVKGNTRVGRITGRLASSFYAPDANFRQVEYAEKY